LVDNVVLDDVNPKDHPDYCDAHISFAHYNGEKMTDEQLNELNEDRDFVLEQVYERLY